jgi:5-methylcytosine-specific restriction endonuclease McrA
MTQFPNVDLPQTESKIFFSMWSELVRLGRLPGERHVLCPLCLKAVTQSDLTLEHIIPQRAVKHDPKKLRDRHPVSNRSGLTLLCRDCNGLKGRFFDPMIEKMFKESSFSPRPNEEKRELKARRTTAIQFSAK